MRRILLYMIISHAIAAAYKELRMREAAAAHLSGIPAKQNANMIDQLYDKLNGLHIAAIEGKQ